MKEILLSKEVIWFGIGLILFLLEFIFPGLVLLFFGVGAWVTSIAAYLFDINLNAQLILFIISSLISLAALRKLLRKKYIENGDLANDILEDEYVGKTAVAITAIPAGGKGKVEFKGSNWEALSDSDIALGDTVKIIDINSIKLIVTPIK